MPPLSKPSLILALLRKPDAEIARIGLEAEQVVFGAATSISTLSTTATYNIEAAGVILEAVTEAQALREQNPDCTSASVPGTTLGHQVRQQPVRAPQGTLFGP